RDEIAAGRFDPARDMVGVRGGAAPLSWTRSLIAPAAGLGRDGWYSVTTSFERVPPGGTVPYKFRIEPPARAKATRAGRPAATARSSWCRTRCASRVRSTRRARRSR
ncbi:hypothetical protein, partial [Mitsuaria sp. TWR114]|uniref:hypothetical protein n=1 Tax=Mitsuaria sp. TWR114 TaxID=2601731 RepID=UPI00164B22ED